jgi:hypothetical protein
MTKPFTLQAPEKIAMEYGGNKQKISKASQSGMVDPTAAVLAGMFIDRMRAEQFAEQKPQRTVADDVLAPPPPPAPPQGPPGGLGALPQGGGPPPGGPPQGGPEPAGMVPQGAPAGPPTGPPPQGMAGGGLLSASVPDDMYDSYATGGLVSLAGGGPVEHYDDGGFLDRIRAEGRQRAAGRNIEARTILERDAQSRADRQMLEQAGREEQADTAARMGMVAPAPVPEAAWRPPVGMNGYQSGQSFMRPGAEPPAVAPAANPSAVVKPPTPVTPVSDTIAASDKATGGLGTIAPPGAPVAAPKAPGSGSNANRFTIKTSSKRSGVSPAALANMPSELADATPPTKAGERLVNMFDPANIEKNVSMMEKLANTDTTEEDALKADLKGKKGEMAKRKTSDMWETLMEVGVGMMGTRNQNFLGAVGEAGQAALPGARERQKDRRTEEREAQKDLIALEGQANARRMAAVTGALSYQGAMAQALSGDLSREQQERLAKAQEKLESRKMDLQLLMSREQNATTLSAANIQARATGAKASDFDKKVARYADRIQESNRNISRTTAEDMAQNYLMKQENSGSGGGSAVDWSKTPLGNTFAGPQGNVLGGARIVGRPQ